MAEQIGGAPEQLDPRRLHFLGEDVGDLGEVLAELLEALALRNDVAIVEGEERKAEGREHLERDVGLGPRALHRLAVPRALEGRRAEHVGPHPGEVVPVADGGPAAARPSSCPSPRARDRNGDRRRGCRSSAPRSAPGRYRRKSACSWVVSSNVDDLAGAEVARKLGERLKSDRAVLDGDRFQRIVADAALAPNEQHAGGTERCPSPSCRGPRPKARAAAGRQRLRPLALRPATMRGIADESVRLMRLGDARADAAAPRRWRAIRASRSATAAARFASSGARMSMEKLHKAGNDVGRAGPDFEPPDRRDEIGFAARALLRSRAPFRPPRSARRGAGSWASRLRGPRRRRRDLEPRCAVDRGHDAKRQPLGLEPGPCSICASTKAATSRRAEGSRARFGIAAELVERLAHQDAVGVALVERVLADSCPRARASR